jgi:hypothetical protein
VDCLEGRNRLALVKVNMDLDADVFRGEFLRAARVSGEGRLIYSSIIFGIELEQSLTKWFFCELINF